MRFIPLFVLCVAAFGASAFACDDVSGSQPTSTAVTTSTNDENPIPASYSRTADPNPISTSYSRTVETNDTVAPVTRVTPVTPMYSDRKNEFYGDRYRNYSGEYDRHAQRGDEFRSDREMRRDSSDRIERSSDVHLGAGAEGHGAGVNVGTDGVNVRAH